MSAFWRCTKRIWPACCKRAVWLPAAPTLDPAAFPTQIPWSMRHRSCPAKPTAAPWHPCAPSSPAPSARPSDSKSRVQTAAHTYALVFHRDLRFGFRPCDPLPQKPDASALRSSPTTTHAAIAPQCRLSPRPPAHCGGVHPPTRAAFHRDTRCYHNPATRCSAASKNQGVAFPKTPGHERHL